MVYFTINPFTGQFDELDTAPGGDISQITTDSGIATPAAGNINLFGVVGCETSASGSTVNINVDTTALDWVNVTGTSATMVKQHGYATNNAGLVTLTLPAPGGTQFGSTISIMGVGVGGWKIVYGAGQSIVVGSMQSTVTGGNVASFAPSDCIELVCGPDNLTWRTLVAPQGNPVIT